MMKKSSGYPNRIRKESPPGPGLIHNNEINTRSKLEALVIFVAIAGLLIGLVNWCSIRRLDQKITGMKKQSTLFKGTDSLEGGSDAKKLMRLKKSPKEKRIEADGRAQALPPQEPGPVDLGSHIKMVLPPK